MQEPVLTGFVPSNIYIMKAQLWQTTSRGSVTIEGDGERIAIGSSRAAAAASRLKVMAKATMKGDNAMEGIAALLNLPGSTGVDSDLEGSAAWNRVATPPIEEALWLLQAHGCIFDATADEWVPVRFPAPHRHRM